MLSQHQKIKRLGFEISCYAYNDDKPSLELQINNGMLFLMNRSGKAVHFEHKFDSDGLIIKDPSINSLFKYSKGINWYSVRGKECKESAMFPIGNISDNYYYIDVFKDIDNTDEKRRTILTFWPEREDHTMVRMLTYEYTNGEDGKQIRFIGGFSAIYEDKTKIVKRIYQTSSEFGIGKDDLVYTEEGNSKPNKHMYFDQENAWFITGMAYYSNDIKHIRKFEFDTPAEPRDILNTSGKPSIFKFKRYNIRYTDKFVSVNVKYFKNSKEHNAFVRFDRIIKGSSYTDVAVTIDSEFDDDHLHVEFPIRREYILPFDPDNAVGYNYNYFYEFNFIRLIVDSIVIFFSKYERYDINYTNAHFDDTDTLLTHWLYEKLIKEDEERKRKEIEEESKKKEERKRKIAENRKKREEAKKKFEEEKKESELFEKKIKLIKKKLDSGWHPHTTEEYEAEKIICIREENEPKFKEFRKNIEFADQLTTVALHRIYRQYKQMLDAAPRKKVERPKGIDIGVKLPNGFTSEAEDAEIFPDHVINYIGIPDCPGTAEYISSADEYLMKVKEKLIPEDLYYD